MRLINLLSTVAFVQIVLGSNAFSYTEEICTTIFASTQPKKVVSATQVEEIEFLAFRKFTTTPSTTITARASTITSTQTFTITSTSIETQVTDTYRSTSTVFDTATVFSTFFVTVLETDTITTTETPPASTIATPPGFTPIASANPGASKKKARNAKGGSKKISPFPANNPNKVTFGFSEGKFGCSPQQYPSKVDCVELIEIISTSTITYTARETCTKYTSAPVVTQTVTHTYTTTTTSMPIDASTTLTSLATSSLTSTSIITSTTTTTETSTITDTGPTPTTYAACAANNIVSTYMGTSISEVDFLQGYSSALNLANPYDCCVACQTTSGCGGLVFYQGYCYLATPAVCDGAYADATFTTGTGFAELYVSNGPCGQVQYS